MLKIVADNLLESGEQNIYEVEGMELAHFKEHLKNIEEGHYKSFHFTDRRGMAVSLTPSKIAALTAKEEMNLDLRKCNGFAKVPV